MRWRLASWVVRGCYHTTVIARTSIFRSHDLSIVFTQRQEISVGFEGINAGGILWSHGSVPRNGETDRQALWRSALQAARGMWNECCSRRCVPLYTIAALTSQARLEALPPKTLKTCVRIVDPGIPARCKPWTIRLWKREIGERPKPKQKVVIAWGVGLWLWEEEG